MKVAARSIRLGARALSGAAAMAMGLTATANTSLDAGSTGDLFLNVVDTSKGSSFLYDTGIAQANFNGAQSIAPINLTTDVNYQTFVAAQGAADTLTYSVVSATKIGATATVLFTASSDLAGNPVPSPVVGISLSQAQTAVSGSFLFQANQAASTTMNSAYLTGSLIWWGDPANEGTFDTNLYIRDYASPGVPLPFYSESSSKLRSASIYSSLNQFVGLDGTAGVWNFTNGYLTYTVAPSPPAWALLLGGGSVALRRSRRFA